MHNTLSLKFVYRLEEYQSCSFHTRCFFLAFSPCSIFPLWLSVKTIMKHRLGNPEPCIFTQHRGPLCTLSCLLRWENSHYRLITFQLAESKLKLEIRYSVPSLGKLDGPTIFKYLGGLTNKIPAGYFKSSRIQGYWCLFHRDVLVVSGFIMI